MNLRRPTSPSIVPAMVTTLPKAPGVYIIECAGNDKIYVGSGMDMQKRRREHLWALRNNRHCNIKLQRVFNKYGEESFYFYVLEAVSTHLRDLEAYWIRSLDAVRKGLNITYDTIAPMQGRKASAETRAKMSQALKGLNIGRKHTAEAKAKIARARLGTHLTAQAKAKVSAARRGVPWMGVVACA